MSMGLEDELNAASVSLLADPNIRQDRLPCCQKLVDQKTGLFCFVTSDESGNPYLALMAKCRSVFGGTSWDMLMRLEQTKDDGLRLSVEAFLEDKLGFYREVSWGENGVLEKYNGHYSYRSWDDGIRYVEQMRQRGLRNRKDLPEQIDFEATVANFLKQVEERDYSRPGLVLPSGEVV